MTQHEFEKQLEHRLLEIRNLYKQYCPEAFVDGDEFSGWLTLTVFNGHISANNEAHQVRRVNMYKKLDYRNGE